MTIRMVVNCALVAICCLLLIVAVLFLALQWGNVSDVTAFGPHVEVNTALLIIFSILGGFALGGIVFVLVRNLRFLLKAKKRIETKQAQMQTQKRLDELEQKAKQQSETPENS